MGRQNHFPQFRMQEIDRTLKIGYAVRLTDLNGDGKPDIVVVDKDRVIWFENPTWQMHTALQGQTVLDNVCLDVMDIDGRREARHHPWRRLERDQTPRTTARSSGWGAGRT